jgi:hypothetical protein
VQPTSSIDQKEIIMALKKTVSLQDNFEVSVEFKDAYIKVESVSGDKSNVQFVVGYYKDDSKTKCLCVTQHEFNPDLSGENFIKQAYAKMKTLPEFAGAQDC